MEPEPPTVAAADVAPVVTKPVVRPYTILVTGSRVWTNEEAVRNALKDAAGTRPLIRLVHGGARGADTIARKFAQEMGWEIKTYVPDWGRLGRKAGPARNSDMLRKEKVDIVLAFPSKTSSGTYDMIDKARKARIATNIDMSELDQ